MLTESYELAVVRRRRLSNFVDEILQGLGASSVVEFLDISRGVVLGAGSDTDHWDDVRGGSNGFRVSTIGPTGKSQFNGSAVVGSGLAGGVMQSALARAELVLDGAISMALISTVPVGENLYVASVSADSAATRLMAINAGSAADDISGVFFPTRTDVRSTVAEGAAKRLAVVSKNGSTTGSIRVLDTAEQSLAITAVPTGSNFLTLFAHFPGTGAYSTAALSSLVIWNRKATTDDYRVLRSAASKRGVVFAP